MEWISSIQRGAGRYPILCRVEKEFVEFPYDQYTSRKVRFESIPTSQIEPRVVVEVRSEKWEAIACLWYRRTKETLALRKWMRGELEACLQGIWKVEVRTSATLYTGIRFSPHLGLGSVVYGAVRVRVTSCSPTLSFLISFSGSMVHPVFIFCISNNSRIAK